MCCNSKAVDVIENDDKNKPIESNPTKSSKKSKESESSNNELDLDVKNSTNNKINVNSDKFLGFDKKKLLLNAENAEKEEKYDDAIDIYNYLMNKNKKDINNYFNLGKIYMKLGLYEKALDIFNKGIKYSNNKE